MAVPVGTEAVAKIDGVVANRVKSQYRFHKHMLACAYVKMCRTELPYYSVILGQVCY